MRTWIVTSTLILAGSALFAACGGGGNSPSGSGGAGAGNGGAPAGPGSGAGTQSGGGGPDPGVGGGPIVAKQPISPYIIVDQFGYRPCRREDRRHSKAR